ncbi:DUF4097 family beta strand repeat protein [Streptomyces sp. SID685]|uniref:DUF4097 family beta strand repeat-containing protein n=1 Tax=Streptomyces sp. SID685 TaxID=2690322 RepID=UPI001371D9DE|nr:DUF4097 family beta strand repeat-containing protein [Streptomyces sp. SID685]MYR83663.1 DUF4097 family beta strand repeat protein [Streptomyces sp. SID685]
MPEFSTPKPITVTVTLNKGRLSVLAGDRADTTVRVRPGDQSSAADVKAAEQTHVEYASGRLLVKAPEPHWLSGILGKSAFVDVTIELPAGSSVQIEATKAEVRSEGHLKDVRLDCVSGEVHLDHVELLHVDTVFADIAVDGVSEYANVNGVSGKVRLAEVSGSAVIKGVNGDVWIGESGSDLHVSTAGGSIFVDGAGKGVTAKTAGGTIRLGRVQQGEAELLTGSGEIEIGICEGSVAWIDAHSSTGSVRNTMQAKDGPSQHVDMVKVRARSRHGDIMIHRASESSQASG